MEAADLDTLGKFIEIVLNEDNALLKEALPQFSGDDLEALYSVGFEYYQQAKYKEAEGVFRLLTTMDYMSKKQWMGLAASQQMQGNFSQAIDAYATAALLDQKNPYIPFYAAECCFSLGDTEKGLLAVDAAEELSSNDDQFTLLRQKLALLRAVWHPKEERI